MTGHIEPSFRAVATACRQLAEAFLCLHAKGYFYRSVDLSILCVDPDSGDLVMDFRDGYTIGVEGADPLPLLSTQRFTAPEVLRGEAAPSHQTDLFALGVLMFYLLIVHHPLEGERESSVHSLDVHAMERLYGTEPVHDRRRKRRSAKGIRRRAIVNCGANLEARAPNSRSIHFP